MGLLTTPAVVIGSMRLGEADKLITFFTLRKGKLKGAAKGARRLRSRFGSSLEPFTHGQAVLFERPGDQLARIQQVDIVHPFPRVREDLEKIHRGVNMINLVGRLTPEGEANPKVYHLLVEGLSVLENGSDPSLSELLFMICLVAYAGYQPRWDGCLQCQGRLDVPPLRFSPKLGGAVCPACAQGIGSPLCAVSRGTLAFMRSAQKMNFATAHRLRPTSVMAAELRVLLEAQLTYILGYPPVLAS